MNDPALADGFHGALVSADDAVERLMQCAPLVDLFGEHFIQTYGAIKDTEYREYFDVVSPWERRFLLLNV